MSLVRTTIIALLVFLLVANRPLPALNASEAPVIPSPYVVIGLVHNMARVSISDVVGPKPGSWVLMKLQPDPASGMLDNDPVKILGSYTVVRQISGPPIAAGGVYSWLVPINYSRSSEWDLLPFKTQACVADLGDKIIEKGYTTYALCRVTSVAQGVDGFQDASWIAPNWQLKLLFATQFARRNSQMLNTPDSLSSRQKLAALASSANPFLSIAALQLLSRMNDLSTDEVAASLNSSDIYTVALIVYNLAQDGWLDDAEHRSWLSQEVIRKSTFDFAAGVATGLGSAGIAGEDDMGDAGVLNVMKTSDACLPLLQTAKDVIDSSTDGGANRITYSAVLKWIFDVLLNS